MPTTPNGPKGRKAVKQRGDALLKLIAASNGGLMLTQAEAADIIKAGYAQVDTSKTEGEGVNATALVTLTDAGNKHLAPAPVFTIDDDVPMPEAKKGGAARGSKYPFDKLEKVGQSFHVPATPENPDPVTALASSLTGARRRYAVPVLDENNQPVTETVKVKTYALDAKGKRVKGEDGAWVVTGEHEETRPKMKQERDFVAAAVTASDPKGPGARVYRKL